MTKSEELINEIQEELKEAALDLEAARAAQQVAVGDALAGDFVAAVKDAQAAARFLRVAKGRERDASKDLVKLIAQMQKDGFANEIIFGVVETLIAEFLGA